MKNLKDEIKKLIREYGVFGDAIIDEITEEIIKVVRKKQEEDDAKRQQKLGNI